MMTIPMMLFSGRRNGRRRNRNGWHRIAAAALFCLTLAWATVVGMTAAVAADSAPVSVATGPGVDPGINFNTMARNVVLLDYETGAVLYEKEGHTSIAPASMTKMMTIYLLFAALKEGSLSLDDSFIVSNEAWRKGGSKMFIKVGDAIRIEDLLRGIVVQSGNDASIALAEGISGSEKAFAEAMTARAEALGMKNTVFRNASGWPDPEHKTTAYDLALLAFSLIRDFPELYPYFAETTFTYNGIRQNNRNPLLYRDLGVDGLKTGYTKEAGYGLAASAVADGRRLVLVVAGLKNERERRVEAERILNWGYRSFDNYALFTRGDPVAEADVWLGKEAKVNLVAGSDFLLPASKRQRAGMKVTAYYKEPLPAPLAEGDKVGRIEIILPDTLPIELPLVVGNLVAEVGFGMRTFHAIRYTLMGE